MPLTHSQERHRALLYALCVYHTGIKEEARHRQEYLATLEPGSTHQARMEGKTMQFLPLRRNILWFLNRQKPELMEYFNTDVPENVAMLPHDEYLVGDSLDLLPVMRVPAVKLGVPKDYGEPKAHNWRCAQLGM